MTPIIRRFVIKLLSKDQGSGITKLPGQMQAGFQESMVTEKLVRNGYDPRIIKSETELKMILNRIDASKKQSKEQKDKAMKQLADIMDMKGRKIPQGSKIMGGEAVETEAEIAARMNRENKEAIERIKEKSVFDLEDYDTTNMSDVKKQIIRLESQLGRLNPEEAGFKKMADDLINKIEDLKNKMKDEFADGGEVSGTFGVLSDNADISKIIDQKVTDYENEYMQRTGKIPPEFYGDKYRMQLQKEYLMENKAYGGRVGLMAGGMGRRAFLKLMAAGGAGIAGLKSGLINIFKPRSQAVNEVVETVTKTDAMGVPEHFAPLVNKIMKEGKLIKESDRIQTYKHPTRKDIDLDYELDSGSVGVRFETDQGAKADYYLKKNLPDEMNPSGGPDEFFDMEEVYRFSPDGQSYSKGVEEGITSGTSNLDEFVGMKTKDVNKSKIKLPESLDDFASGGIARMLGE